MGNKKIIYVFCLTGKATPKLMTENDSVVAHRFNARKRFDAIALSAKLVSSALISLFDGDTDTADLSAALVNYGNKTSERASVCKEVVDYKYIVLGGYVSFGYHNGFRGSLSIGIDLGGIAIRAEIKAL